MKRRLGVGVLIIFAAVYLVNASWLAPKSDQGVKIIAHRGVHQTYHREGLTLETCTAERIYPPTHEFIENTIPSIREAFRVGADIVEIDIHATTDGEFAVFHDWTLDCRTEGRGRTIDHTMEALRQLDLGYGYTADEGETYPLRGKGIGMMPTLAEVLEAFPDRPFMVNAKSNNPRDAEKLDRYLSDRPEIDTSQLIMFASPKWVARWRELRPEILVISRPEAKACAQGYVLWGWSGHIPASCQGTIGVPLDFRRVYWGWPRRLNARFQDPGVILTGPLRSVGGGTGGIDTLEHAALIPPDYSGYVMTNRVEVIAPALKESR